MAREVVALYTLFIDTHDKKVLIILYKDGKIFNKKELTTINKHSEVTMPAIDDILKESDVDVTEINSIIVVNGPGSFTGERIAVTIAKTFAYSLKVPIRTIDALTILATGINDSEKIVALEDRNGAFVGFFDQDNNPIKQIQYMNKSSYTEFKANNEVHIDVVVDYEQVYEYVMNLKELNPHEVKPLYIKGISALDGK